MLSLPTFSIVISVSKSDISRRRPKDEGSVILGSEQLSLNQTAANLDVWPSGHSTSSWSLAEEMVVLAEERVDLSEEIFLLAEDLVVLGEGM